MFSNEQLEDLIGGKIIGGTFPYDTGNEQEIEAHIRRLFYRISRIPDLVCEAEWNHFGSGYASFVEFFCFLKEEVIVVEEKFNQREEKRDGLIIDICRLAPVAIMGQDERYRTYRIETNEEVSGAYGSLLDSPRRLAIPKKSEKLENQLKLALQEFNFSLLQENQLDKPLPFKARIPTLYRNPKDYLIMDAIFYWED